MKSSNRRFVCEATMCVRTWLTVVRPLVPAFMAFLFLGHSDAFAQKQTWTKIWGTSNAFTFAKSVAVDSFSNIFVCGTAHGSFDGQPHSGSSDAFVSKFDRYGNRLWTRIWGSATDESVGGVAVDRNGYVYVAGDTLGAFDGETNTLAGKSDFFLTKWSNNGQWMWTRIWGSTTNDYCAGVVINSVNWPHVAGHTAGGFGGQTNSRPGAYDLCLTGFSTNGVINPLTVSIWGGTNSETCSDVAIDSSDRIYLAGIAGRGVFEGITNVYPYNRLILSACDLGGARYWSALWGATNKHNDARSVWAGAYVYVTGVTFGNFDGQSNYPNVYGNGDLFISQFSVATGARNWSRIYGSNSWEEAHGVAGDSAGNAYVTGVTGGAMLDGQPSAGGADYFLIKYDTAGARSWTRLWGSYRDDDGARDAVVDPAGNVFVCGISYGPVGGQFNPGESTSSYCPTLTRWRMGANTLPQPSIAKPAGGREFIANEAIQCIGSALDADDSTVTNLVWSIGTNVVYGYGVTTTVSAAVAPGSQTVTARAIDSEAGTGSVTVAVTVLAEGSTSLPLSWEQSYWPLGGSGGGTNDYDGDGMSNWREWLAGTNPTNIDSVLRVQASGLEPSSSRFVLTWSSVSNREYSVGVSSNLVDGFTRLTNVAATPTVNVYTTPVSSCEINFYNVEVGR